MRKFAFLIHPRDTVDVARRFWITRFLPNKWVDEIIKRLGPVICSRFKVFNKAEGYIIAVPLTGKQIKSLGRKFVRAKIMEAVLFAQDKLGAEVIGLGALIASVTDGGEWIIQQPGIRAKITHGDSYAIAVAEEGIEKIINLAGLNREEVKIAIVGAYGLIGKALAKVLAQKYQLILVGKSRAKLERLKREIQLISPEDNIFTSLELADIYDADIVVTATSHPEALIQPEHLKYGAIAYDIAQPMNVSPDLVKERPDILKIDGAYVNLNGIQLGFDMGPPSGTTFACCAETIMQALENKNSHHTGEIDVSHVELTKQWAEKYRFTHAPFSCFSKLIPLKKFQEVSENKNRTLRPKES